jgi:predicted AAA+ superfamily ATPase
MAEYRHRLVEKKLQRKLIGKGAVLIEGAKWCGKTSTGEYFAKSIVRMNDPKDEMQMLQMAKLRPGLLLDGETPRLIDEWQLAPQLWDAVRFEVDKRQQMGQFILTGSAVPPSLDMIHHTGTGRIARLMMRPMTLFESQESSGEVSLSSLFNGKTDIFGKSNTDIDNIAYMICRGGWPLATFMTGDVALEQAFDYYDAVVNADISRVDGVHREKHRVINLMRSYARNQGSQVSIASICADMMSHDTASLNEDTVMSYINALKKIFVIEEMPAWNPNIRSKTAIRTSDTRYYVDPSIATAALGLGPKDLLGDLQTFGLMFETMCVRDLRVYAEINDGEIFHYRDKNNLECDAVVHLRNGSYGLIEIKLGGESLIAQGAESLKKLASIIDTDRMKPPSFMMVVTAVGNFAYKREDGVLVVPVTCLRD